MHTGLGLSGVVRRVRLLGALGAALGLAMLGAAGTEAFADTPALERLKGHGGPIKGIAVSPSGRWVLTSSFDYTVGVWSFEDRTQVRWLEAHNAAANAATFIDERRVVSVGDDFSALLWDINSDAKPVRYNGHKGKVIAVAVAPDRRTFATASWDGTVGLFRAMDLPSDTAPEGHLLNGHRAGVNAVAFTSDGRSLFSASTDGTIRRWRVSDHALQRIEVNHGFGINNMILAPDDSWLAYGATDGIVRVLDLASGKEIQKFDGGRRPVLAMALSPSGKFLAYGDGKGYISVIETETWTLQRDFRAMSRGPVWALAYNGDDTLIAGGLDDFASLWPIGSENLPEPVKIDARRFQVDPDAVSNGERQFARKCSICHSLTRDSARRAGPTLYNVFGRPAGTLQGYAYSPALKNAAIVWSPETLDKLFDLGPDHYTPGSKMPMQRIAKPEDRADLIAYLKAATTP